MLVAQWLVMRGTFCTVPTFSGVTPIADGTWHHVVGVIANGWARLYVDGFEELSAQAGLCAGTDGLSIAARSNGVPFTGDVDEVAVYAGALPLSRVIAHYAAGANKTLTSGPARYYMGSNSVSSVAASPRGAWNNTSQGTTAWINRVKVAGTPAVINPAESVGAANWDVLGGVFETQALPAQTISGTLNWVLSVKESAAAADFNWHVHAWVAVGETSALRGTLLSDYTEPAGTNEFPTAQTGWGPSGGAPSLSPVSIQEGDHVVIEVGYVAGNSNPTTYSGTIPYRSGGGAPDLSVGDIDTTHPSWFEFSGLAIFSP